MTQTLNILVVEDNEDTIAIYERAIRTHNRANPDYLFEMETTDTKVDAIDKLTRIDKIFDGAIIDLDLNDTKGYDSSSGREVIRVIKEKLRFPVFVISGTIGDLSEDEKEENDLYRVVDRNDGSFSFIDEFIKIHATGITDILNRTGKIEEYMNKIYWEHLSTSLRPWMDLQPKEGVGVTNFNQEKKQSLIRYVMFHLQEYLDISSHSNRDDLSDYFPAEFFITGPIKNKMFTGDIFIYRDCRYVALTPACDFSNSNVDRVLCVKINEFHEIDDRFKPEGMSNGGKKELEKYLTNNKTRFHFIPSLYFNNSLYNPGIIDFQNQISFTYKELTEDVFEELDEEEVSRTSEEKNMRVIKSKKAKRIATISQPFLKDLIERYSRYFARQGAPNISRELLKDNYLN